ncbi:hypothetical protein SAMN05192534_12450 [Alteribacillus persepolensis]|uniref:Uncharacterized protein n=1 Tax=Alteribacillus persepolensis TaxID=568899 RepID=A0A1G8IJT6_9BACI|nr:hypothetical protein [Alteribacillus persepolensis]SDI19153.1 hypothetical protein SAMN05192534_12450 [Alteribacillus persepolensis]
MNKYNVKKRFRDKFTRKIHAQGSVYETNDERGRELQEKGFLGELLEQDEKKDSNVLEGNAKDVVDAITADLSEGELTYLHDQESNNKARKSVLSHIESLLGDNDESSES